MARWQRPARYVLLVFALAFAVVVFSMIRRREPPTSSAPSGRTDETALTESTRATVTQHRGARQDFEIKFNRRRTYEGGRTKLDEGVEIFVRGRQGRDFVIKGQEADVAENQSTIEVRDNVTLSSSDGLTVKTASASYSSDEGLVRVPGPLTFASGRMSGSGVGATYDRNRDFLHVLDQSHMVIAVEGQDPAIVDSGSVEFARRDRYVRFERNPHMTRGAQVVDSDRAVAYLAPTEDRIQMLELRGNSRVKQAAPTPGGLDAMAATDMNLAYADDGRTLQRATLVGTANMQTTAPAGQAGRKLAAQWLDMTVAPDGATLTGLAARDNVQVEFPAEANAMSRRVRSASMQSTGTPEQGLTSARFADNVEMLETKPASGGTAAVERNVRSRTLETGLTPGFGSMTDAHFTGGVTIKEGTTDAAAPEATYRVASGTVTLVAAPGGAGSYVREEQTNVDAPTITFALESHNMQASGGVKSVLKGQSAQNGDAGASTNKRPTMLQGDVPVNVTADALDYDRTKSRAFYEGNARLFQGDTTIIGNTLTLDDASGNLAAEGQVRSAMTFEQENSDTKAIEKSHTIATGDKLDYEEARRLAIYTTNARLVGTHGDLKGDRIELYLDPTGRGLERVEAFGKVFVKTPEKSGTGTHLTYFAAEGRYRMDGVPVRVLEQIGQDCRETLGKTLTFFRSTDTITVDGNQESRTQTKSGGKCPDPPQD